MLESHAQSLTSHWAMRLAGWPQNHQYLAWCLEHNRPSLNIFKQIPPLFIKTHLYGVTGSGARGLPQEPHHSHGVSHTHTVGASSVGARGHRLCLAEEMTGTICERRSWQQGRSPGTCGRFPIHATWSPQGGNLRKYGNNSWKTKTSV